MKYITLNFVLLLLFFFSKWNRILLGLDDALLRLNHLSLNILLHHFSAQLFFPGSCEFFVLHSPLFEEAKLMNSLNPNINFYLLNETLYFGAVWHWARHLATDHPEVPNRIRNFALIVNSDGKASDLMSFFAGFVRKWGQVGKSFRILIKTRFNVLRLFNKISFEKNHCDLFAVHTPCKTQTYNSMMSLI